MQCFLPQTSQKLGWVNTWWAHTRLVRMHLHLPRAGHLAVVEVGRRKFLERELV